MLRICFALLIFAGITLNAAGDRQLSEEQVGQLLADLTAVGRQTWLPYGMIKAHHLQYHEVQNKITDSTEIIYFDGPRYAWQIDLNPGQSLDMNRLSPAGPLEMQPPSEDFMMNRSNFYLWNGQKQVRYYKAGGYAVVQLSRESATWAPYGPPSAGIIPWGHGDSSLAVLRANSPAAYELSGLDGTRILLEYTETKYRPAARVSVLLDPAMDYAVVSYSMENDLALLRHTYQDYRASGAFWVPRKIMIERFDKRSGQAKLTSYDDWQFEQVDFEKPDESRFAAVFEEGTVVEMQPAQSAKTFLYQAPGHDDIEPLLADKISILAAGSETPSNCATAALSHAARKYAKTIPAEQLTRLVSDESKKTSLADLQSAAQAIGLESMAITTDLDSLAKFSNCMKIAHLPANNHYVIIDRIEPDSVWIIDLVNRKFYWKKQRDEFLMEWTEGTALLLSDSAIAAGADCRFDYLDNASLGRIEGGDFGYSCTDKLQDYQHILCDLPVGFLCSGLYYVMYERYGCKEDINGGTCVGKQMVGYEFTHCINNLNDGCTITGVWESRYIRACQ
ncbi:MAG: hypothetical protein LLF76_12060 [Planctomycetaceae bacterium]|nr:hypothetical protein [Planctomycetaceae bacterium]